MLYITPNQWTGFCGITDAATLHYDVKYYMYMLYMLYNIRKRYPESVARLLSNHHCSSVGAVMSHRVQSAVMVFDNCLADNNYYYVSQPVNHRYQY